MVFRRLVSRATSQPLATSIMVLLIVTLFSCSSSDPAASSKSDGVEGTVLDKIDPAYAVPDGSTRELFEFVAALQKKRPKPANHEEFVAHQVQLSLAIIRAGDKIIQQGPEEESLKRATEMKLSSLIMLAANQVPGAIEMARDEISRMRKDANKIIAAAANESWMTVRILGVPKMNAVERNTFSEEVLVNADGKQFDPSVINEVMQLGQILEMSVDQQESVAYYNKAAEMAGHHGTPQLTEFAEQLKAIARRTGLLGNPMQIEAVQLDGTSFDWASYRGKVVLVDFWATWCGPCVGEIPNVQENYARYHDKGFEVVGISLDRDPEQLRSFIQSKRIPWVQLYDEKIQKGRGGNHPVAVHYAVDGIPWAVLVDREGKVVSVNARGPELTQMLEKLLGKAG